MSNENENTGPGLPPLPDFKGTPDFNLPPPPPPYPMPGIEDTLRGVFIDALKRVKAESAAMKLAEQRRKNRWFVYRSLVFAGACAALGWALRVSPGRAVVIGLACFAIVASAIGIFFDSPSAPRTKAK